MMTTEVNKAERMDKRNTYTSSVEENKPTGNIISFYFQKIKNKITAEIPFRDGMELC